MTEGDEPVRHGAVERHERWIAPFLPGRRAPTATVIATVPLRNPASPWNPLLGNARQTELVYQTSRSFTLATSNVMIAACSTAVLYIGKTRTTLKSYLGERWSTAWNQAGFDNGTLQIPATDTAAVVNIARTLQSYLLANPAQRNSHQWRHGCGDGNPGDDPGCRKGRVE